MINPNDPNAALISWKLRQLAQTYSIDLVELLRLLEEWQEFQVNDLAMPLSKN